MVVIEFLLVFTFAAKITNTLTPGGTTSGHNFVVAFPYLLNYTTDNEPNESKTVGRVYVSTDEQIAVVDLYFPHTGDKDIDCQRPRYTILTKFVKQFKMTSFDIDKRYSIHRNGIHCALYITASVPVRAWAIIFSDGMRQPADKNTNTTLFSEAFKLIPLRSSKTNYHLTTNYGYPFLMVISFNFGVTEVNVNIPLASSQTISVEAQHCKVYEHCLTQRQSSIKLKQHHVWFLYSKTFWADFQGIEITTTHPVFIVSGNPRCFYHNEQDRADTQGMTDVCVSSLNPVDTWGDKMFVPALPKTLTPRPRIMMRVNALEFPLEIRMHSLETKITTIFRMDDALSSIDIIQEGPYLVYTGRSFQLSVYMFISFPSNVTQKLFSTSLNVVPVNQWINGHSYQSAAQKMHVPINEYLNIASSVEPGNLRDRYGKPLIFKGVPWKFYHEANIKTMTSSASVFFGKHFFVTNIENPEDIVYYIVENPGGKLMFFHLALPINDGHSFTMMPWDYYMAQLQDCKPVNFEYTDDGIDNDCDGRVDEEYLNKKDDDGDEKVDEDCHGYNDGVEWAPWVKVCKEEGTGYVDSIRVRSCTNRGSIRFGETCKGQSIQCGGGSCPEHKMRAHRKEILACLCKKGCGDCQHGHDGGNLTGDGVLCMMCKPNYFPDYYCTTMCPPHRTGKSCMDFKYEKDDSEKVEQNRKLTVVIITAGICALVIILGVVMAAYYSKRKRKRFMTRKRTLQSIEAKRKSTETDSLQQEGEMDTGDDDMGIEVDENMVHSPVDSPRNSPVGSRRGSSFGSGSPVDSPRNSPVVSRRGSSSGLARKLTIFN